MKLNKILTHLEKELSIDFLSDYYQDEILRKDIISKQIYFIDKNKIILRSKPLYINEPFTLLDTWIPLDDTTRIYNYDKNYKLNFKNISLKISKKLKIKEVIMNVYLFTI